MDSDDRPQLHGVVIVTLPPPDKPSLGKTITAYTLTDDNPNHDLPSRSPPPPPPHNPQLQFSFSALSFRNPRKMLGVLTISLLALFLYTCSYSDTFKEFKIRDSNDDDQKPHSFVLPLYRKSDYRRPDLDRRSRRLHFVAPIKRERMSERKVNVKLKADAGSADSSTVFPVRGNVYPDGLYYTQILVGNPRRTYFLDIDTGSDLAWVQCDAPCTSCAKGPNALYKPTTGNIVTPVDLSCTEVQRKQKAEDEPCESCQQCDYEINYADHSSSMGVLVKDELHIMMANGSLTKLNLVFGCGYDQQGSLLNSLTKTNGILGLSRAKVSFPSQLASEGIINNVVGHCLATDVYSGGYMFLGDDFVPQWGMSWVPMLDNPTIDFYQTEIVKMSYGSAPLSLSGANGRVGRVVFDTGSSYTYFPEEAYSDLVASLDSVSASGLVRDLSDQALPICWQADFPIRSIMEIKRIFKTITLHFESKWWIISRKLQIPPEGYLIINKKGNLCLGILDGSKVHDGSTVILGDISLHGQLVVYDNVKHRIGWSQQHSDCVKPTPMKSLPIFEG